MKRYAVRFFCYSFIYIFLASFEKKYSITGLCIGFLYALVFCKENPFITLFPYLTVTSALTFTTSSLLYVFLSVFPAIVLYVLYYLFRKKIKLWIYFFFVLSSQTARFFLYKEYIQTIVGCVVGMIFFYICVSVLFAIVIRGVKYRFTVLERIFLYIFTTVLGAGSYLFNIYSVSLFYPLIVIFTITSGYTDREKGALLILFFAFGGSIAASSFLPFGIGAVPILINYMFSFQKYLGAVLSVAGFVGIYYLFNKPPSLFIIIPVLLFSLVVFIPSRYITPYFGREGRNKYNYKTIINRDREEMRKKITKVADAYDVVGKILKEEENILPKEEELTRYLSEEFCRDCTKRDRCGEMVTRGLRQLVTAALDNGRASPMDVAPVLGENCVRLPKLLKETNDAVKKYKEVYEQKEGVIRGKEMMIKELAGMSETLKKMAGAIRTTIEFDSNAEKKIKEQLSYANIIASDVLIYGDKEEIILSVRKKDAEKEEVKKILSDCVGVRMMETDKRTEVDGTVSITFERAPYFGILYGESSRSAKKDCGDSRRVIKIDNEKIMFVLSDGMGTGSEAEKTANEAVDLIGSFYQAGFDHKTVFGSVSKLLSLKKKEDFSAVDVVICDIKNGSYDFIKQGGRESYVISGGNLEIIEGGTLPLGILEETEPKIVHRGMRGGDFIFLISDGVADRLTSADFAELLGMIKTGNPQIIAEKIIEAADNRPGQKDDMTAIVIRVVKNK